MAGIQLSIVCIIDMVLTLAGVSAETCGTSDIGGLSRGGCGEFLVQRLVVGHRLLLYLINNLFNNGVGGVVADLVNQGICVL